MGGTDTCGWGGGGGRRGRSSFTCLRAFVPAVDDDDGDHYHRPHASSQLFGGSLLLRKVFGCLFRPAECQMDVALGSSS